MATVQNFNQTDPNQNQQDQLTNKPISISGTPASSGGGTAGYGSSAAPTVNPNTPTSSGNFANLKSYLTANQGYNAQGGGLAGRVSSDIQSQGQTVQNQVGQTEQQFQNQAIQNTPTYNQNLVQNVLSNPNQASAADTAAFVKMRDAAYGGPTQTNLGALQGQAQNVQSLANLTTSQPGQFALLQRLYGSPQYNQGQQSLDQLLLQGAPNAVSQLAQARQAVSGLNPLVQNATAQEQALINQGQAQAANVQNQTRAALGQAATNFDVAAQQQAATAQANANQAFSDLQKQLQTQGLTPELAAKFGVTRPIQLYGVGDLQKFLVPGTVQATAQNVLTPDQYAQIQALSNLSGGGGFNENLSNILAKYSNPSQAGAFQAASTPTFNNTAFQNAINQAQGQFRQDYGKLANYGGQTYLAPTATSTGTTLTTTAGAAPLVGTIRQSGDPLKDIAALQADIATRQQALANAPQLGSMDMQGNVTGQQNTPLIQQQNAAIASDTSALQNLQNLLSRYGMSGGNAIKATKKPGMMTLPNA